MKTFNNLPALLFICSFALSVQARAQVQLSGGTKLVTTGQLKLVFQDISLENHGDLLPGNSTFIFTGNNLPAYIGGSKPVNFYHLLISKPAQDLQLNTNINVAGILAMDQGSLALNKQVLDLGYTGSISGERNSSRITGQDGGIVKAMAVLDAPRGANPGNIGVEITSNARLGETIIVRGHSTGYTTDGHPFVQRYYDVKPQYNTRLKASIRFHYLDAELKSSETGLMLYSARAPDGSWTESGKDNIDASANWIVKNDLDQLHRFTLAGGANKTRALQPGKTSIQLFPNPARDQLTIVINSPVEIKTTINLYDHIGRLLESKPVQCREGLNTISWNILRYATGSYYLYAEKIDAKLIRFVKQ